MRQRHVDDRGVEDFHERRERHRDRDEPGIVFGLPDRGRCDAAMSAALICTVTVGSTEMPSGSGMFGIEAAVDHDLDRHPLHHLDEVAGRILRRKGGEFGARAELDAVDMAAQIERRIGVDLDPDRLPGPHVGELALLEVGGDPDFGRDDRENLLAGGDVIADLDIAFGDPAVLRRLDLRP